MNKIRALGRLKKQMRRLRENLKGRMGQWITRRQSNLGYQREGWRRGESWSTQEATLETRVKKAKWKKKKKKRQSGIPQGRG